MLVPAFFYAHRCESPINQDRLFYHITLQNGSVKMEPENKLEVPHRRDRRKKIAKCVRINQRRIFAGDQIRRDQRIKSPGGSPALGQKNLKLPLED